MWTLCMWSCRKVCLVMQSFKSFHKTTLETNIVEINFFLTKCYLFRSILLDSQYLLFFKRLLRCCWSVEPLFKKSCCPPNYWYSDNHRYLYIYIIILMYLFLFPFALCLQASSWLMWSPSLPQVTFSIGRITLRTSSFCTHQDLMDELCCIQATKIWRTTSAGDKQIVSVSRKWRFVQLSSLLLWIECLYFQCVDTERRAAMVTVLNKQH